jgi:2'-5' RNA ligase
MRNKRFTEKENFSIIKDMRHRVFIAINLPEDIKKKLTDYQSKWSELPCRWTKKDNLHITPIFIGYVSDEELMEICKIVKEVASRNSSFSVNLTKICYGPPKKPPRMVWVTGEKSPEFVFLKEDLEKSLLNLEGAHFSPEKRVFSPHITLGRIRTWEFRQIEPEERPEVNEDISFSFEVNSIEVMESQLKRGGAEYTILESVPLSK